METEDDDLDEETILSRFGRGRLGRERATMQAAMDAWAQEALPTSTLRVAGGITPEAAGPGAAAVQQQAQQQQAHVQVREQRVRVEPTANPNPT